MTNRWALPLIAASLLLGGCLSDDSSEDTSDTTNQTETGSNGGTPAPANPPTISGTPPSSVQAGETYSFQPNAVDPDGDTLTFSIENQPNWAAFDATTGRLSGTPTTANVGQVNNILISVSDGNLSASLDSFDLSVVDVGSRSVVVSWEAPTQNEDGTALTNLAGFRVYYGTEQGVYPNRIEIDTTGLLSFAINNLTAGTYYFVTTAVNASGEESDYSDVIAVDLT